MRTLSNTTEAEAAGTGVKFAGSKENWTLICKAWNKKEGWMRSTKALEIEGLGCLVQVSTIEKGVPAEALTFVPGAFIEGDKDCNWLIDGRSLK